MTVVVPAELFPPGEYIQDEMEARRWTHDDLASVLRMSRRQVINLIQGKSGITPDTAHALGDAFEQDAQTWMNLQLSYELALAGQKDRDVKRRATIFNKLPVREVLRRAWLPNVLDTDNTEGLETAVCKFLNIGNISEQPNVLVAARKGTSYDSDSAAQVAWYRRAMILAESAPAARFDESQFESGIRELLKLAGNAEDARRVPKVVSDMGIRLVLVEKLKGTKIDGVAFWLDPSTPAIALSLRHDRIDNFWFTLMHEMTHIKYKHASVVDVDITSAKPDSELPGEEVLANTSASQYLIDPEKMASFIARKGAAFLSTEHPGVCPRKKHSPRYRGWATPVAWTSKIRSAKRLSRKSEITHSWSGDH